MRGLESVLVLGNSWHSLLVACSLKKKIANLKVTLSYNELKTNGAVSVRRELSSLLSVLELTQESLLRLCDGTYFLAHHIVDESYGREFYWSVDDYGISDEVQDFHQLFERFLWPEARYDDFCVTAQLSKYGKVIDLQRHVSAAGAQKKEQNYSGLHLNIIPFTRLLLRYATYLGITVVNEVTAPCKEKNEAVKGEALDSAGARHTADFVIDASYIQEGISSEPNQDVHDWTHYFGNQYATRLFVANDFNPNPTSSLVFSSDSLVNAIPLRTGVAYEYLGNKIVLDKFLTQSPHSAAKKTLRQNTYGCLCRPWQGRKLALGLAAARPGNLLVSELDLLMQELALLIGLWPSVPFQPSLAQEYNRLATTLYCSVRDMHLLGYWLIQGGELSDLQSLPTELRKEVEVFIASSRLPHRDERYPAAAEWISLLMGLKKWPIHFPPLRLERADNEFPDFFQSILNKVREIVANAPQQVAHINDLLRSQNNHAER
ncbi:tryptophan 7-halogenase [Cellvibrio sp. UBA7671]|uniref:tryptophan 7-halogenase n=1 Tax=Cellvibrio sp. UBA7671 TaxID=1946312 RepID=UPI002F35F4E2